MQIIKRPGHDFYTAKFSPINPMHLALGSCGGAQVVDLRQPNQ